MSITVFKPQHVRWLPKPITLWAVWEGTDGKHHEETFEYTAGGDEVAEIRTSGGMVLERRRYKTPPEHPLLTDDYKEDPEQVMPGTLRFVSLKDAAQLSYCMTTDNVRISLNPKQFNIYRNKGSLDFSAINGSVFSINRANVAYWKGLINYA